jgi:predicted metal-dependent HD superfamily phosphohydrolase
MISNPNSLEAWKRAGAAEGLQLSAQRAAGLLNRYREQHRAYHTPQHLEECLAQLLDSWTLCERPGAVALALWYHDAIYDTSRQDNEERSAELARQDLAAAGAPTDLYARVAELVLATRHQAAPEQGDEAILVDIDLSILGASADRFDDYERQIREEYAAVSNADYKRGRMVILRQFLDRPAIFSTRKYKAMLETAARTNLNRSLVRLQVR